MNYTQIVNVFRLHNIIEPSAALFWALGIVLAHILKQLTQPSIPQVRQGSVRFNLKEEEPPLPFSLLAVYLFYGGKANREEEEKETRAHVLSCVKLVRRCKHPCSGLTKKVLSLRYLDRMTFFTYFD